MPARTQNRCHEQTQEWHCIGAVVRAQPGGLDAPRCGLRGARNAPRHGLVAAQASGAARGGGRLAARLGGRRPRSAPFSPVPPTRSGWRRAPAAAGDVARLRPGCGELRGWHAHEPAGPARTLYGALPRAGSAGQCAGLLELVRHRIGSRRWRSRPDREGHRPGLPAAPGRSFADRDCRAIGRRQHGRAAGRAPARALQGAGDAFGRSARHRALRA